MKSDFPLSLNSPRTTAMYRAVFGLGLLSLAATASAASVSGNAEVDWSSLSFRFLPSGASVAVIGQDTSLQGYLPTQDLSAFSADWSGNILTSGGGDDASASLAADASHIAIGGTVVATQNYDSQYLEAVRGGVLEISGTGVLVVSVAGRVSSAMNDLDSSTDYAYSQSSIGISLWSGALFNRGSLGVYVDLYDDTLLSDEKSDVIAAALNVRDGDWVEFRVTASTDMAAGGFAPAPVPVPASLPLLASALLGLTGIRRTRTRRIEARQD